MERPIPPAPPKDDNDRAARWVKEDMVYKERLGEYLSWQKLQAEHPEQASPRTGSIHSIIRSKVG